MRSVSREVLYGAILSVGCANAFIRPVMTSVAENGWWAALAGGFGVSFVVWFAYGAAVAQMVRTETSGLRPRDVGATLCATIWFCVPSATLSWLGVGVLALWVRYDKRTVARAQAGAAIFAFLAFREPAAQVLLNVFAETVLGLDAALVALVLNAVNGEGSVIGNMVSGANGHRLLVMTGCSSYTNVSLALLGWYALTHTVGGHWNLRTYVAGFGVAVSVVVLNIVRLTLMGLGPDPYRFFHDGFGVDVFQIGILTSTLLITWWGFRHDTQPLYPLRAFGRFFRIKSMG